MFKKADMEGHVDFGSGGFKATISFVGGNVAKKNPRLGFRCEFIMSNAT